MTGRTERTTGEDLRLGGQLAVAASAAGALLSGLYKVRTHDTFFHLATGRTIVELGHVPRVDPFSFTAQGSPWVNHSAGFQVLAYALHQTFGFVGLSLLQALLALSLFALGVSAVERRLRAYACVPALAPFVFYREVLEARPHVLGFVCFSLVLSLTSRIRRGPSLRQGLALLSIYGLFASVHGSHLLVLVVCALALAFAAASRDALGVKGWGLVSAGCIGLCAWLQPDAFAQGPQHLSSEFLESNVAEWRPLSPGDLLTTAKGFVYLGCLALSLMGAAAKMREPGVGSNTRLTLALLAMLSLLSLTAWRMVALFLFAGAPVWLPLAAGALRLLLSQVPLRVRWGLTAACTLALFVPLFSARDPFHMGVGLDAQRFPIAAVERLQAASAPKRVYNAYNFGAYLMWRRTPRAGVFVDGRAITVYPPDFLAAFHRAYEDMRMFDFLSARFAVDGVLMPRRSPRVQRLLRHLSQSPTWQQLHRDELSVLYARRDR